MDGFYCGDLHLNHLKAQLIGLYSSDGKKYQQSIVLFHFSIVYINLKYVMKVANIILLMLVRNVLRGRNISALLQVKTWLHTTTDQTCLNWYLIQHVHKDKPTLSIRLRSQMILPLKIAKLGDVVFNWEC